MARARRRAAHTTRTSPTTHKPTRAPWTAAVLVVLAVALSGCTGTGDNDARLEYEGASHGTDSDVTVCDGDAHLSMTVVLQAGMLVVTVRDGDNATAFQRTMNQGIDIEDEPIKGAEGSWTLEAIRSQSFDGLYDLGLDCEPDFAENGNTTDYERSI